VPFYVPFVLFAVVFLFGLKYPPRPIRHPFLVWSLLVLGALSAWLWLAYPPSTL
jgi:hypothetical protein